MNKRQTVRTHVLKPLGSALNKPGARELVSYLRKNNSPEDGFEGLTCVSGRHVNLPVWRMMAVVCVRVVVSHGSLEGG
jgi:hypothetical protein